MGSIPRTPRSALRFMQCSSEVLSLSLLFKHRIMPQRGRQVILEYYGTHRYMRGICSA